MTQIVPRWVYLGPFALATLASAAPAAAHVKWFAPYIVGAAPRPASTTLVDRYFWIGIALVLVFFIATRLLEARSIGQAGLAVLDRISNPLWNRLDDFLRATIAAFFVAIFAVGGVYLTPDLKIDSEVISWAQLAIAACVMVRPAMPLAALGLVGLWVLALRDYDLFHLLDYLALGLGVAGYLLLATTQRPEWRRYRYDVLRLAVAVSLMWSSLEKFAYPEWFYPLVVEKPYLTFGLPRDAFIPMAGVAEFTLGFGLMSTPLVRRLSAIALFVIFNAAVYPFGRIDLIGHGLIMAALVAIAADHRRAASAEPRPTASVMTIPATLTLTLVIFAGAYWGSHDVMYDHAAPSTAADKSTHTHDPDHPHAPNGNP